MPGVALFLWSPSLGKAPTSRPGADTASASVSRGTSDTTRRAGPDSSDGCRGQPRYTVTRSSSQGGPGPHGGFPHARARGTPCGPETGRSAVSQPTAPARRSVTHMGCRRSGCEGRPSQDSRPSRTNSATSRITGRWSPSSPRRRRRGFAPASRSREPGRSEAAARRVGGLR